MLHLGTSGWTAPGWLGTVYPRGTKQADFIAYYSTRYATVEIDATFYATPSDSTIAGWREKTRDGFIFAAKAPKVVTHTKCLVDCQHEWNAFLKAMSGLGPKLGPIVLQFPYYTKRDKITEDEFLIRLSAFLKASPQTGYKFAVECRNKQWMNPALFTILREHRVACCLIDHPWMLRPGQLFEQKEIVTAPFVYIRWIGDRKKTESITKIFDHSVFDRSTLLQEWVPHVRRLLKDCVEVYGYVGNHYSGHAPADVELLARELTPDSRKEGSSDAK